MSLLGFLIICVLLIIVGYLIRFPPLVIFAAIPLLAFFGVVLVYLAVHNTLPQDLLENITKPGFF